MFNQHVLCVCRVPNSWKKAMDSLELELQVTVNHHVVLGFEPQPSDRATSALNH